MEELNMSKEKDVKDIETNVEDVETNVDEKNINTTESIENVKIDAKHTEVAKKTAKAIKNKKMVEIKIPIDSQNPKDLIVPVIINGYRWEIKRGEKVLVPEPVAKILEDSKYI
jgi:hypothetical protein